MKKRRAAAICAWAAVSWLPVTGAGVVHADPIETPAPWLDKVRQVAEQALREHFSVPGSRIEITSAPLDLRLRLVACREPLRATVARYAAPSTRMTVRVQCPQPGGWSVPVALQLKLFRTVLVASRPLLRGDGLAAADVHAEERDVTRLAYGYIENLDQVAGRSLTRALANGSVISPGVLGGRRMVRAGDHVQMVARLGSIEVRAAGVALGSGDNGARMRVRNESSGKVVDAMVSAPGEVTALP